MTNDIKTKSRTPLWFAIAILSALLIAAMFHAGVTQNILRNKDDELADARFRAESTQRLLDDTNEQLLICVDEAKAWKSASFNMANSTQAWLAAFPYGGDLDLTLATADVDAANSLGCIE